MSPALRCFLAVRVPPMPQLADLIDTLRRFGRPLRCADPRQLHVTLKFLGQTDPKDVAPLAEQLRRVLAEVAAARADVVGLGAFPSSARPSVVWAGVETIATWRELAERCETACESFGYARERRAFHPHVTLARVNGRAPDGMKPLLASLHAERFGAVDVRTVELMQSTPGDRGSQYTTLAAFPLKA